MKIKITFTLSGAPAEELVRLFELLRSRGMASGPRHADPSMLCRALITAFLSPEDDEARTNTLRH